MNACNSNERIISCKSDIQPLASELPGAKCLCPPGAFESSWVGGEERKNKKRNSVDSARAPMLGPFVGFDPGPLGLSRRCLWPQYPGFFTWWIWTLKVGPQCESAPVFLNILRKPNIIGSSNCIRMMLIRVMLSAKMQSHKMMRHDEACVKCHLDGAALLLSSLNRNCPSNPQENLMFIKIEKCTIQVWKKKCRSIIHLRNFVMRSWIFGVYCPNIHCLTDATSFLLADQMSNSVLGSNSHSVSSHVFAEQK